MLKEMAEIQAMLTFFFGRNAFFPTGFVVENTSVPPLSSFYKDEQTVSVVDPVEGWFA